MRIALVQMGFAADEAFEMDPFYAEAAIIAAGLNEGAEFNFTTLKWVKKD